MSWIINCCIISKGKTIHGQLCLSFLENNIISKGKTMNLFILEDNYSWGNTLLAIELCKHYPSTLLWYSTWVNLFLHFVVLWLSKLNSPRYLCFFFFWHSAGFSLHFYWWLLILYIFFSQKSFYNFSFFTIY